jgi:formate hydrogenlyase subunit 4
VPRVAAESQRPAAAAVLPHAAQALLEGVGRGARGDADLPHLALRGVQLHAARLDDHPTISTNLPLAPAADAIALVGLFALARLFISLAAMDIGTAFGTLGARREMLIGFLAEPAFLMVLFTASLISHSTSLATIVASLSQRELTILPSLAFAGIAFTMVSLAENARIPVDNPTTHLELTMIHEALTLEYSGRPPRAPRMGRALKLFAYLVRGHRALLPVGDRARERPAALLWALPVLAAKLAVGGFALA